MAHEIAVFDDESMRAIQRDHRRLQSEIRILQEQVQRGVINSQGEGVLLGEAKGTQVGSNNEFELVNVRGGEHDQLYDSHTEEVVPWGSPDFYGPVSGKFDGQKVLLFRNQMNGRLYGRPLEPAIGMLYLTGSGSNYTASSTTKMPWDAEGLQRGVTFNSQQITVKAGGVYRVDWSFDAWPTSGASANLNTAFTVTLYKNNSLDTILAVPSGHWNSDAALGGAPRYAGSVVGNINKNDVLDIRFQATEGFWRQYGFFSVQQII